MLKPMRKVARGFSLAAFLLGSAPAFAQPPVFEVASVRQALTARRAEPGFFCLFGCFGSWGTMNVVGTRVDIAFMGLDEVIVRAYGIKEYQLSGPAWMANQRFDILATIPAGVSKDKIPEMLQALLAERFKLAVHRGNKEQPVYGLLVNKNGPKLKPSTEQIDPDDPAGRELNSPQGPVRVKQTDTGLLATTGH
jgi:uncharacterized protein (TIGR03435 family)